MSGMDKMDWYGRITQIEKDLNKGKFHNIHGIEIILERLNRLRKDIEEYGSRSEEASMFMAEYKKRLEVIFSMVKGIKMAEHALDKYCDRY